jgi:hypothetical protein
MLSGSALAYEILLMRLFSIIQWHHFAYMIIGLALLGYGISGAIVSIYQQRLLRHFEAGYISAVILFALTSLACFSIAQHIPFNAEVILWDELQLGYLSAIFLLLAIPFFFAATAICLAFMQFGQHISRLYAMDLLGAGLGSLASIAMLYWLFPTTALLVMSIMALLVALVAMLELGKVTARYTGVVLSLAVVGVVLIATNLELNPSPYKGLPQLLQISATKIIKQKNSPLGFIQVVESEAIPLRHAPGLSLNATREPLPQLAVFTDADNMTVLTKQPAHRDQLAYLDQMTSALPFHLQDSQTVLVLGAGGGSDILQAQYHQVDQIEGVELNPQIIELVNHDFAEFTGGLYNQEDVSIHQAEVRDFLTRTEKNYDLIQLALVDTFNASSSGLYALNESYLYTIEALQTYLSRLTTGGSLAITRWVKLPPRDSLKVFASLVEAMELAGISNPEQRLIMIRSWQTSTVLAKKGEFTDKEIETVKSFCKQRSFDLVYHPGIEENQVNRFNVLSSPVFYQATQSILSEQRQSFFQRYKFNLQPATDDQPYFHQFFKWSTLNEILSLRDKGGMPLIEWGYITLMATLVIAIFFSVFLIVIPVWLLRRRENLTQSTVTGWHVFAYFLAIGIAFLFIEIAMMQKFILFLHHPVFSIAVTLTGFLVLSGLGSAWSGRLLQTRSRRQVLLMAVVAIALFVVLYVLTLPVVFDWMMGIPVWLKVMVTIVLIAPLAFFMGMPFPLALGSLDENAKSYIPWAWAINGCASVMSAVLATILAIHFGFTTVLFLAILLYVGTLFVLPAPRRAKR